MKNKIILLYLIVASTAISQWNWQNPFPTGNTINKILFFSGNIGLAAGWNSIIKTTDGGITWSTLSVLGERPIYDIFFISENEGWAAGDNFIYHTENSGEDWNLVYNQGNYLTDIFFINENKGWAIGYDMILFTQNGGATWVTQDNGSRNYLYDIYFIDENNGYIASDGGYLLKTNNGGQSWTTQFIGINQVIFSLFFIDTLSGWLAGSNGLIMHTADGGNNWIPQEMGNFGWLKDIAFADGLMGFAAGNDGTLISTIDGGNSWSEQTISTDKDILTLGVIDASKAFSAGENGFLASTENGGVYWENLSKSITDNNLLQIKFLTQNHGLAVGSPATSSYGKIFYTFDGGLNWNEANVPAGTNKLFSIDFIDIDKAWAVGGYGTPSLVYTEDGGINWTETSPGTTFDLYSVDFISSEEGWAVGEGGVIIHTEDGGGTWNEQNSLITDDLASVTFVNTNKGWAAGGKDLPGMSSVIIYTLNGGGFWLQQVSPTNYPLKDIQFLDETNGWAVGGGGNPPQGVVIKTTDGGQNWNIVQTGFTLSTVNSLYALSPDEVWFTESWRTYHTTDAGNTWEKIETGTGNQFNDIYFISEDKGWISGPDGAIMTLGEGGTLPNTAQINVNSGWNIVSVPLLLPDMNKMAIFQNAISNAFKFENGYVQEDVLENGAGYWIKFNNGEEIEIQGETPSGNIPISQGWNIIGPFNEQLNADLISTSPEGIVESNFFGFSGGYVFTDILEPGKGYWVKASQSGEIVMGMIRKSQARQGESIAEDIIKLDVKDASGSKSTLYLAEIVPTNAELPPLPPNGIFDARFSTNEYIRSYNTENTILLKDAQYPVIVEVSNPCVRLGGLIPDKNGNYIIKDSKVKSFNVEVLEVPVKYSLSQNYPNPFNPATIIKFSIPERTNVKLKVYDLLGREVGLLLNEVKNAGNYELKFDAAGLSSGIYFYSLEAGNYKAVKKMMLVR